MRRLTNGEAGCMGIIAYFLLLFLAYGASWLLTCGIVKLITVCFGLTFNWLIGTGVWLVMILAKSVFTHSNK